MGNYVGKPVKRVEDRRFITGKGRYVDDMVLPRMTYACIIRSPHAHARIKGFDTAKAEAAPGVVAVFTGEHIKQAELNGLPTGWQVNFKNGDAMKEPPHPILAWEKVRYAGDAVAVVIAETANEAKDAGELVEVHYEVLEAVADCTLAANEGAPQLHDDVPRNTI